MRGCYRRSAASPGIIVGGFTILLGVYFLLRNFGLIRHFSLWDLLPIVLIAFGVANVLGSACATGRLWGGVLILTGAYWLGDTFHVVPYRMSTIWPVLLILLGAVFLYRALRWRRTGGVEPVPSSVLNELAVFGGGKRGIGARDFQGGELYAVCGGLEIDLRAAQMEKEVTALDATAVFGGIELRVPETWNVDVQGIAVFGGYEDKTAHPRDGEGKKLIIRGFAVFGGVEVKN